MSDPPLRTPYPPSAVPVHPGTRRGRLSGVGPFSSIRSPFGGPFLRYRNQRGTEGARRATGVAREAAGRNGDNPDPEVTNKAIRRRFSAAYKRRVVGEADQCTKPDELVFEKFIQIPEQEFPGLGVLGAAQEHHSADEYPCGGWLICFRGPGCVSGPVGFPR